MQSFGEQHERERGEWWHMRGEESSSKELPQSTSIQLSSVEEVYIVG
jgi:hypothetical protein